MASRNRRPHETATSLNQNLLDYMQDNLDNNLQIIAEIESPQNNEPRFMCEFILGNPGVVTCINHTFIDGQSIVFETSFMLPTPLNPGQKYYVSNVDIYNFNISHALGGTVIAFGGTPYGSHYVSSEKGLIRISDRNILVGSRFYEARTKLPVITRTVGEWLRPEIEFSSLQIEINNIDKKFSSIIPGGDSYDGHVNKEINVKIGLRDILSTYFTIFRGFSSEIGGFQRNISTITYIARDSFERLAVNFPTATFNDTDYPKINPELTGQIIPIIYGDYTSNVAEEGNIPTFIVNTKDPKIHKDKEIPITFLVGIPGYVLLEDHNFDHNDAIRFTPANEESSLPSPLNPNTTYYVNYYSHVAFTIALEPNGASITLSGGAGDVTLRAFTLVNIRCVISQNNNVDFLQNEVWLVRNDLGYKISSNDITNISGGKKYFEITQNTGQTIIEGENFYFKDSDQFLCKVKGKNLNGYNDNVVAQAYDLLRTYTLVSASEFDQTWETYKIKSSPPQSAIQNIKSRLWVQESQSVLMYTLSMFEQVRIEYFISKDLKIKINALHLESFPPNPQHTLRNFDIVQGSLQISSEEKSNFNRAQAFFDYNPRIKENSKRSLVWRNSAAVAQDKKAISKQIEFPNLYIKTDVENQLKEILKISSAKYEIINCETTARQLLLDIGDFVKASIQIDSIFYDRVPMMIREIGYSSELKIILTLWSFQMIPFGNGSWSPNYAGIVGGDIAIITAE